MKIPTLRRQLLAGMLVGTMALIGCQQGRVDQQAGVENQPEGQMAQQPRSEQPIAQQQQQGEQRRTAGYRAGGDMAAPQFAGSASLVEIRPEIPPQIRVGSHYEYQIHVTNTSDDVTLHQVEVRQKLPPGLEIESSNPPQQQAQQSQQQQQQQQQGQQGQQAQQQEVMPEAKEAMWKFDSLGPGESQTIQVTAIGGEPGKTTTCFMASYLAAQCVALEFVKPEVELVKRVPEQANLCETFPIIYQVTNSGSAATPQLTIRDELPEGLQTAKGEQTVSFQTPAIEPGETRDFSVDVTASERGQFGSRAVASMGEGEEHEVQSNRANTQVVAADLRLAIEAPEAVYLQRPLDYTITVTNQGDAPAQGTRLVFDPEEPAYLIYAGKAHFAQQGEQQPTQAQEQQRAQQQQQLAANGQQQPQQQDQQDVGYLSWDLGTIEPGDSARVNVTLQAADQGMLTTRAVAAFVCEREKEGQEVATRAEAVRASRIIALPGLLVSVVDREDPVPINEELVYEITVVNQGDAADQNVQVSAELPENVEFIRASGTTPTQREQNRLTFGAIPTLEAGERATWEVTVRATQAGDIRFPVELKSESLEQPARAEEPTQFYSPEQLQQQAQQQAQQEAQQEAQQQQAEQQQAEQQPAEQQETPPQEERPQEAQPEQEEQAGEEQAREGEPSEPQSQQQQQ